MSVRVVARIRPLLKQELDKDVIVTSESTEGEGTQPTIVRIPNPKNEAESFSFQFSSVYEQETTQQQVFESEVAPTVKHLFNGYDTTIFSYGPTGTGKTHTMRGGKSLADRGVIPRLLSNIYRRCRKIEKDTSGATHVSVTMSYYEIYCDRVFDLFEPPEKRTASGLPIRDNHGKTVVVGLREVPCTTLKEFETLYDQANINRSTSATKLNAHSSRSHAILTVKITQTTEDSVLVSQASAIDLAGSEDNRRTDNNKERMVESSAINKSLFVLAQCVDAISKKQSRIPYRESKMTRILSLGQNNGMTLMVLNLAPVRSYHMDTLSSLNVANRTKKIEVCEVENEPIYRSMVKPLATTSLAAAGGTLSRQPLRPLTAANNANLYDREGGKKKGTEKPAKAFAVYSDNKQSVSRPSNITLQNQGVRRAVVNAHKRPAESSSTFGSRPTKTHRPAETTMTKASIEALIAQRIDEKLAEKALQDAATATPALSAELQKRLDELEQRIDAKDDDGKSPGLQFLLMAKQHQARGEDVSALRMLKMASPYFPENEKLATKIRHLEERIKAKKASDTTSVPAEQDHWKAAPAVSSSLMAPLNRETKDKPKSFAHDSEGEDDEFAPVPDSDNELSYASDSSFRYKSKASRKPKNASKKLPIFRDTNDTSDSFMPGEQTPRTKNLLRIINSKDVSQIKALKGVGVKKADAIVACLLEMADEEVKDLHSLAQLNGVGKKTVENMRGGLLMKYDF
ncbi:kinesin-domain-containing protein [Polyplosphaeria fusca]|uniref:Kinesin-domain-containing protein n=1 Tax=Polyplosphaeria fusca TaxID=682080 RepID=A0A9P4R9R5_9PLEO|nr:kinesin-domain-containing protein [Polyplosphaeria fusca]